MGGRPKSEAIYVYLELTHIITQQKLTQQSKAIILQKKKRIQPSVLQGDRV